MLRIAGTVLILSASVGIGYIMCDSLRTRLRAVDALAGFIDHVSVQIELYKTPLDEIYESLNDKYLKEHGFTEKLSKGVFQAAVESGLLMGDEETELIRNFSDRIGGGTVEDMVKLCAFTSSGLRNLDEKLRRDLPDKQRIFRTISLLAGASAVIMFI